MRFVRIGIAMAVGCALVAVIRKGLLGFESEFLEGGFEALVDLGLFGLVALLIGLSDREYFGLSAPKDEPSGSGLRRN
jgi:hypothetical protein